MGLSRSSLKAGVVSVALSLFLLHAFGQQDVQAEFRWDSHHSQELNWKQSISRSHLSPSLRADLIETIVEQMREDQSSNEPLTEARARSVAAETRIELADLTGHGRNEVIAQAGDEDSCSPTGNCPFWILRHERDGYHAILHADSAQTFTIQPNRTHGHNDIVVGMHGSAFESMLTLYKYNGSIYKDVACYNATWQVIDKSGNVHDLKEPRITPCGSR